MSFVYNKNFIIKCSNRPSKFYSNKINQLSSSASVHDNMNGGMNYDGHGCKQELKPHEGIVSYATHAIGQTLFLYYSIVLFQVFEILPV